MKIQSVKEREGSLRKLKSLLDNKDLKVHGVSYTNNFFSQHYLCRSSVLVNDINIKDNIVKLTLATRVEQNGLPDLENTLEFLARYEAGDIPGFTPEGMYDESEKQDTEFIVTEPISISTFLISVDILLKLTAPTVKYKEFTIAGEKFTLVELHQVFEVERDEDDEDDVADDFEQSITLLFGSADKMYLLSHFYDKDLNIRDMKMILDLFVDENLTGKAIRSMACQLPNGITLYQFPFDSLVNSYTTLEGDYIFGSGFGYVRLTDSQLKKFKMECVPSRGGYSIQLLSKELDIIFALE